MTELTGKLKNFAILQTKNDGRTFVKNDRVDVVYKIGFASLRLKPQKKRIFRKRAM
ncbi:hypothetical protein WN51_08773 [Melipona quadrifasciata]|uniref:Uncharacterized protein n=1 Tax=Melipona quadrifasciata TaxID=166423 RepID=A0A0M8ZMS4_9HYME|nr:hypothetical protein WN51_08773 [Melipona quadrifasciata]